MKEIKLSVHDFVDILLRKGDIDNRVFNTISMHEGTRLHAWYQAKQTSEYMSEVYLSHIFKYEDFILNMDGRADGIIVHEPDNVTIDEIKTTNTEIDKFYESQKDWHLGQALVYAYIYLTDHNLSSIKVQLTYISQLDNAKVKQFLFIYTKEQLEKYINDLLRRYCLYLKVVSQMKEERQKSIIDLPFPFANVRNGQEEMMNFAYETVKTNQIGFCEAKTGIGKTVSALYPYIKELGERNLEKIFYLTSKSSIKKVAYDTLKRLNDNGGKLKGVVVTSKAKICPNAEKGHCNPDECLFAKNYYDKVNDVIFFALRRQDLFKEEDILDLALSNQICPFEFQLDLLNYADVIVGDYNYLFDPSARLVRFFETFSKKPYLLLVDEAHNLPTRVRDMFSAEIDIYEVRGLYMIMKKNKLKASKPIRDDLENLIDYFNSQLEEDSSSPWEDINEVKEVPDALEDILKAFLVHAKRYMHKARHMEDAFLDFFYTVSSFDNLPDNDERYAYYFTFDPKRKKAVSFSISCLDPRYLIKDAFNAFDAGLLFSATFSPKDYFIDLCGGDKDSLTLNIPSPFKRSNELVIADTFISTKYKDRDYTIGKITSLILGVVNQKVGNYMVFFPSFEYMLKFKMLFSTFTNLDCYFQEKEMSEEDRALFLSHFVNNPIRTTIGFTVLGGIFSEGIDLTEDRLIGAIIVSVGLPKLSYLEDRIAKYYGEENPSLGHAYAYTFPGINRVVQAAGRVIRGENDKGVILFIDTRYIYPNYKDVLKSLYGNYIIEGNVNRISEYVKRFWEKKDE